ncbi:MAG: putative oxidoreductase [Massilia sp.]|nr:putative oxidoreductase [Massilia sp.]
MNANELQQLLLDKLGADCVVTAPSDLVAWTTDWRGMYHGQAAAVVRPRTTEDVAACVALCAAHGVPVVPRGGNTGLCGAATPDQNPLNVVLSLDRMNAIVSVDPVANTMVVQAGCILGDLQRAAEEHGRLFPLSLAAEDSCQIGGNLATNAGGVNVVRYGMVRDLVLGLEVVLPSGEIWNGLRTLRKDNTGYDLKQLFLGSEGTLGIITAAALRIFPATKSRAVALVAIDTPQHALDLFSIMFERCAGRIDAFEYFSGDCLELVLGVTPSLRRPFAEPHAGYVLVELGDSGEAEVLHELLENALGDALERECCSDVAVASSLAQACALWQLREDISEAQRVDGPHLKHDVSLPIERIPAFIEAARQRLFAQFPDLRLFVFGHLGDGNLHYNVSRPRDAAPDYFTSCGDAVTDIILDEVARQDGSFSAEHGIGQLKRKHLRAYKSALEIRMMEDLKRTFDPKGIMNPGKIL